MPLEQFHQPTPQFSYLGVPAAPGMSDCYESMSRTPIRDRPHQQPLIRHSRHPFANPAPPFVIPAKAGIQKGWGAGIVALGLVPSLGRTARSRKLHRQAYQHFHPLMRPSQGHGHSGDRTPAPYPDTGPESRERMGAMALERCRRLTHSILILCCAGGIRQRRYVGNFEGLPNRQRSPASLIDRHGTLQSRSKRIRPCPASCWSPRTWQSLISRSASLVRVDTHMRRC